MCSSRYRSLFQFYRSFVITEQYLRRLKCLRYYVLIFSRISFFTSISFSVRVFPFGYIRHGSQNSSSSSGIAIQWNREKEELGNKTVMAAQSVSWHRLYIFTALSVSLIRISSSFFCFRVFMISRFPL